MNCNDCIYFTTLNDTHCMKMHYGNSFMCKIAGDFEAVERSEGRMTNEERILKLEEEVRFLTNRCYALTKGGLCDHCILEDCTNKNKKDINGEKPKRVRRRDILE